MKRKNPTLMAILLLVFVLIITSSSSFNTAYAEEGFSGGNGTEENPYQIGTAEQLDNVRNYLDKYFILVSDIDLSVYDNWEPIGNDANKFSGALNGSNHVITNLSIDRSSQDYAGLFGYINYSGNIYNLGIENANVIGEDRVGGLAGKNDGLITNCFNTGNVSGNTFIGGLVGHNWGTITNCSSSGSVQGVVNCIGGLVGGNFSQIINSYSEGSQSGQYYVGGLVGYNSNGTINQCYSTGNVSGIDSSIGGLVGSNLGVSVIIDSHNEGVITGSRFVGGLIGSNGSNSSITNCYNTGSINGSSFAAGGLVGDNDGAITGSYNSGMVTSSGKRTGGLVGDNAGPIENCYSTGSVTSTGYETGGLIGRHTNSGTITNSFSTGNIISDGEDVGGLTGINWGSVANSYWDQEKTGQTSSTGGTGKTTTEMMTIITFENWDFVDIWRINEGIDYPRLQWESDNPGEPNDDANLSSLKVNGTMLLEFNPDTLVYYVELPYGTEELPIAEATPNDSNAIVEITQADFLAGSATVVVTAEDGITQKTYTVNFGVADPSDNADLENLKVNGTMVTEFNPDVLDYQVELPYGTIELPVVEATANDSKADVEITQAGSVTGSATVIVTAEDGVTKNTYLIDFRVEEFNNDAYLKDLKVNDTVVAGFDAQKLSYVVELPYGTEELPIAEATPNDSKATVEITQADSVTGSATVIVTAENGVTKNTYIINYEVEVFSGGSGTKEDPYQIVAADQLDQVRNYLDKHFVLIADIDLSIYANWQPIGSSDEEIFRGTINGNDHNIKNLTINNDPAGISEYASIGFFRGTAANSVIKNLGFENIKIIAPTQYSKKVSDYATENGATKVGGLVGYNQGTIINCSVSGSIQGGNTGGIAGYNSYGEISGCSSTASVTGDSCVGGLVGYNSRGEIKKSYSTGSVTGNSNVGGLVGYNYRYYDTGTIEECYSTGNVTGDSCIGGLLGTNVGKINNTYSTGNVDGDEKVGGLVGDNNYAGDIWRSFSAGKVTGNTDSGGLIGTSGTDLHYRYIYYDSDKSEHSDDEGKGKPKTTLELMQQNTYVQWDFDTIWRISEGKDYPRLQWEPIIEPPVEEDDDITDLLSDIDLEVSPAGSVTRKLGEKVQYTIFATIDGVPAANETIKVNDYITGNMTTIETDAKGAAFYETEIPLDTDLTSDRYNYIYFYTETEWDRETAIVMFKSPDIKVAVSGYISSDKGAVEGARVKIGVSETTTNASGYYRMENISFGKNIITIEKDGYYSCEKEIDLYSLEGTRNIKLIRRMKTDKPVIKSVRSKYSDSSNTKDTYFIKGIDLDVIFEADVDWQDYGPGYLIFKTPKKEYQVENAMSYKFNMGSDIKEGGRLKVIAVSADGRMSEPIDAMIEVAPSLPLSGLMVNIPMKSDKGFSMEFGLEIELPGGKTGVPAKEAPVIGEKPIEFGAKLEIKGKYESDGTFTITYGGENSKKSPGNMKSSGEGKNQKLIKLGGYEITGAVGMDITFKYDPIEKFWVLEGGALILKSGAKIPIHVQYIAAYLDGYVAGEIEAELGFNIMPYPDYKMKFNGEISPKLSGRMGVGLGNKEVLSGEVYIILQGEFTVSTESSDIFDDYNISFIPGGEVKAFVFTYMVELEQIDLVKKENHQLYAANSLDSLDSLEKDLFANITNTDNYSISSRKYSESTSSWMPDRYRLSSYEQTNIENSLISSNIYPQSEHRLVKTDDGIYLVWIADNEERSSINRTELKYAKFDGMNWSEPKSISDDGTGDFGLNIGKTSNGYAAVWQNIGEVLSEDADLDYLLSRCEIAYAQYHEDTAMWSETVNLTDDEYFDRSVKVASGNNDLIVTWIRNESNQLYGSKDAPNQIVYAKYDGIQWTTPESLADNAGLIMETEFIYDGNAGVYSYILDEDDDLATRDDRELYICKYDNDSWSTPIKVTSNIVDDSNLEFVTLNHELNLFWHQGDDIVYIDDFEEIYVDVMLAGNDNVRYDEFELIDGNEESISLLYTRINEKGKGIFVQVYDQEKGLWGNTTQLTYDNRNNRDVEGIYGEDGSLYTVYNSDGINAASFAQTDLCMVKLKPQIDLEITSEDIQFLDDNLVLGGKMIINANVKNNGELACGNISVEFYDGDPANGGIKIGEKVLNNPIPAMDNQDAMIEWNVPKEIMKHEIFVIVNTDEQDINIDNNKASNFIGFSDLEIRKVDYDIIDSSRYAVTVSVANKGVLPVEKGILTIYEGDAADENIIGTVEISDMTFGYEAEKTFEWNVANKNFENNFGKLTAVITSSPVVDEDLGNNTMVIKPYILSGLYITDINPIDGEENIKVDEEIIIEFNKALSEIILEEAFILEDEEGYIQPISATMQDDKLSIVPKTNLKYDRLYILTVKPQSIKDVDGDILNNEYKYKFTTSAFTEGDINNDGKIDLLDLAELSKSYGLKKSDPEYDITTDINHDDIVDIYDLIILAKIL